MRRFFVMAITNFIKNGFRKRRGVYCGIWISLFLVSCILWPVTALATDSKRGLVQPIEPQMNFESIVKGKPVEMQVPLTGTIGYRVLAEKRDYYYLLSIYRDEILVFSTKTYDRAKLYLSYARSNKIPDILLVTEGGSMGNGSFEVIGCDTQGQIRVLSDPSSVVPPLHSMADPPGKSYAESPMLSPSVVQLKGKIGIAYYPAGAWTQYKYELTWSPADQVFNRSIAQRVNDRTALPIVDKTVDFCLEFPGKANVKFFKLQGGICQEIHLKVGEKLLLRRNSQMDQEMNIVASGINNEQKNIAIDVASQGEHFVVRAIKAGIGYVELWRVWNYDTVGRLNIIVE